MHTHQLHWRLFSAKPLYRPMLIRCQLNCGGQLSSKLRPHMKTSSNGTSSALLVICAGSSPVTAEFPAQKPVTRSFDVFFDLRLNKRLSNNSETGDLRRHRVHYDVIAMHTQILAQGNVFENVPYMISILCKLKDTNLFGREHKLSNRRINSISWFYKLFINYASICTGILCSDLTIVWIRHQSSS